jgi:hypothetical protein
LIRFFRNEKGGAPDAIGSGEARRISRIDWDLGLTAGNLALASVVSADIVDALREGHEEWIMAGAMLEFICYG